MKREFLVNSTKAGLPEQALIIREPNGGGFIRVNRTFVRLMGLDSQELTQKDLLEWIQESDRDGLRTFIKDGAGSYKARHQTKTGEWIAFEWRLKTQENRKILLGKPHGGSCRVSKRSNSHARSLPATMHEILAEMALIIEEERPGLKCSVLLLNDDGSLSAGAGPSLPDEYNKSVEGLLIGPSVGSCGTAAFWNERVIVEDIQNDPLWTDLKVIAGKAGVASCWSHPIISRHGNVLGATALYSPTPRAPTQQELDSLGTAARMFGLAIDHAYAEQALERSKAARVKRESELEDQLHQAAKMEALGVLAGGVAHDFNNMLASILSNAEMAIKTVSHDGETSDMLQDIIQASKSASELCSQMLAYAGRGVMSKQKLECNQLIAEIGGLLQVAISKKSKLDYDLSDQPIFVEGDKSQLVQVFMNLITNASEALMNEPGTIRATTRLKSFHESELSEFQIGNSVSSGTYVEFIVSDTGNGMNDETIKKLFDPFFTTKFTGRGLGMAAVKGIILRHNGYIKISSQQGKGTTFTILLPSSHAAFPAEKVEAASQTAQKQKRVLLVDDEPQVRRTLGRVLKSSGFDILQAEDGISAIECFRENHDSIDCVLLDLSMPDLDGEETFHELKKIRDDVRVVLNSGYAEEEILDRIEAAGFSGLLHKPAPIDTLISKLHHVIDR